MPIKLCGTFWRLDELAMEMRVDYAKLSARIKDWPLVKIGHTLLIPEEIVQKIRNEVKIPSRFVTVAKLRKDLGISRHTATILSESINITKENYDCLKSIFRKCRLEWKRRRIVHKWQIEEIIKKFLLRSQRKNMNIINLFPTDIDFYLQGHDLPEICFCGSERHAEVKFAESELFFCETHIPVSQAKEVIVLDMEGKSAVFPEWREKTFYIVTPEVKSALAINRRVDDLLVPVFADNGRVYGFQL